MKALVKFQKGTDGVELREVEKPSAGEGELLVKVYAGGICGTDIHILNDEYEANYPVVMGHEYSGTVEEVGKNVKGFQPGDRIISMTAVVTCGECEYCRRGLLMLCPERKSIGSGVDGAFTEYIRIPAELAFHIPENVSMDVAALSEPLACVVRGVVEMANIKAGDYVYVSGPGAIGQLAAQVARVSGAHVTVGGTDLDIERLEMAKELGASETINVMREDAQARAMEITGGRGFDVAFECAGAAPSAQTCLEVLKKTGQYGQVGLYGKKVPFDHDLALKKEIHIVNSYASERTSWEIVLKLFKQGNLRLEKLISNKIPLERWREAFDIVERKEGFKVFLVVENEDKQ
ncbi:MAG: zinc-binding dehydrogenase [Christensenella sp.]|nr:zinc-binding dehydrogenase [Christensenella sp.]